MDSNSKKGSSNKHRLTLLASIMSIGLLGTGCKEDNIAVENTNNASTETIKTFEESPVRTEKNIDIVANNISQKVNKAKEVFEEKEVKNSITEINNNESMEIVISDIYVVDGDTIYGLDETGKKIKVRLTGIDAPESSQPMGMESSNSLRDCVSYNDNALLTVQLNNSSDKYGRTLAKVQSAEIDCNQQQIEKGMAWFYEDFSDKLASGDKAIYKKSQDYAQENKLGIWSMDLQKPWEYRQENK